MWYLDAKEQEFDCASGVSLRFRDLRIFVTAKAVFPCKRPCRLVRIEKVGGLIRCFGAAAPRISGLAPPGADVASDAVESLIRNDFELEARAPVAVKGVAEPIIQYRVVSERTPAT